jgi:hypothetical protein
MSTDWVEFDREESATAASSDFANRLGESAKNIGQGREHASAPGEVIEVTTSQVVVDGKYNPAKGVTVLKEEGARWLRVFLGFPAKPETTFPSMQVGRTGAAFAFEEFAQDYRFTPGHEVVTPFLPWPVIPGLLKRQAFALKEYDAQPGKIGKNAVDAILDSAAKGLFAGKYLNTPYNATSVHYSREDIVSIVEAMVGVAATRQTAPFLMAETPYAAAFPMNLSIDKEQASQAPDSSILRSGLDGMILKEKSMSEQNIRWGAIMGGSKFIPAASPGFHMSVFDDETAKSADKALGLNGLKISHAPQFMANMAKALSEEFDDVWIEHFTALREKYQKNDRCLREEFGVAVRPGDISIPSIIRLPSDIFNRAVLCSDGKERIIRNTPDLIEYLGNEFNVVVVDNGKDPEGNDVIRVAKAVATDVFEEAVTDLSKGIETVRNGDPVPVLA